MDYCYWIRQLDYFFRYLYVSECCGRRFTNVNTCPVCKKSVKIIKDNTIKKGTKP